MQNHVNSIPRYINKIKIINNYLELWETKQIMLKLANGKLLKNNMVYYDIQSTFFDILGDEINIFLSKHFETQSKPMKKLLDLWNLSASFFNKKINDAREAQELRELSNISTLCYRLCSSIYTYIMFCFSFILYWLKTLANWLRVFLMRLNGKNDSQPICKSAWSFYIQSLKSESYPLLKGIIKYLKQTQTQKQMHIKLKYTKMTYFDAIIKSKISKAKSA